MSNVAICHDYIGESVGGGETEMKMLSEGLAKKHNVDFYVGYNDSNYRFDVSVHNLKVPFRMPLLKHTMIARAYSKLDLNNYDTIISENYWSTFVKHPNHIHHCEAPIRQLYDMRAFWLAQMKPYERFLFNLWAEWMIPREQKAINNCKTLVANSEFTKTRIQEYYHRDSVVIYPPVITESQHYIGNGDFWLYAGRLDYNKRIKLLLDVFAETGKKLVIVGDGPLKDLVMNYVSKYDNIVYMGFVSDDTLGGLYATCMATVYLPFFEDFGQVPVEGMASGKPCLGVPEGGLLETIVPHETGWLLYPRLDDLVKMVNQITPEDCKSMRKHCEKQARRFDIKNYLDQWEKIL